MEECISLFVSNRDGFFKEKACINCPINTYCACDGVDVLFDIEGVIRQELINVGQGVRMTEPIKVEKELITGNWIYASLLHQGIFAVCVETNLIQFTNLNTNQQVKMKVENTSLVGFYDTIALVLAWTELLKEVMVESIFNNPVCKSFKKIEGTDNVSPHTDVSLLHGKMQTYMRISISV